MKTRAFGWIQNPSDFTKLKLVVQVFDSNSLHYQKLINEIIPSVIYHKEDQVRLINNLKSLPIELTYQDLVGGQRNELGEAASRKDAIANGILQVTVLPQSKSKKYTDNWTADGFLRWAVSFNFIAYSRSTDTFKLTHLGLQFSQSKNDSEEEKEILRIALLSYPPATQILHLLSKNLNESKTKFSIGNELGFIGERGFTSYDEEMMTDWLKTTVDKKEAKQIKVDIEGTSDKYARMIANWLKKVGFVSQQNTKIQSAIGEQTGFPIYKITATGLHAYNRSLGKSKHSKITKFLMWEFLATTTNNRDYVRTRRAFILKNCQKKIAFDSLMTKLEQLGFKDAPEIIKNDILGLNRMGIKINDENGFVFLKDSIVDFSIPRLNLTENLKNLEIEDKKAKFLRETKLPLKYIELLEIAYDGKRNRDFEILTVELFKKVYGFNGLLLGGGRKPDGIIYTNDYGVILDTKAYSKGYSKSISQEDEMVRYIEDNKFRDKKRNNNLWWTGFPNTIDKNSYYFMWISSKFVGQFTAQLKSTFHRTQTYGAALNVEQLLIGANLVIEGKLNINDIPKKFFHLDSIQF